MQFLVLLDCFEREQSQDALPLGVLVDHDVLHPAICRTTVVLREGSARKSERALKYRPRTE